MPASALSALTGAGALRHTLKLVPARGPVRCHASVLNRSFGGWEVKSNACCISFSHQEHCKHKQRPRHEQVRTPAEKEMVTESETDTEMAMEDMHIRIQLSLNSKQKKTDRIRSCGITSGIFHSPSRHWLARRMPAPLVSTISIYWKH